MIYANIQHCAKISDHFCRIQVQSGSNLWEVECIMVYRHRVASISYTKWCIFHSRSARTYANNNYCYECWMHLLNNNIMHVGLKTLLALKYQTLTFTQTCSHVNEEHTTRFRIGSYYYVDISLLNLHVHTHMLFSEVFTHKLTHSHNVMPKWAPH